MQSVYLQLFATLAESPMNDRKVERLLLMEPSLCYRLLRVANSAAYGFRHRLSTIQAALHGVPDGAARDHVDPGSRAGSTGDCGSAGGSPGEDACTGGHRGESATGTRAQERAAKGDGKPSDGISGDGADGGGQLDDSACRTVPP